MIHVINIMARNGANFWNSKELSQEFFQLSQLDMLKDGVGEQNLYRASLDCLQVVDTITQIYGTHAVQHRVKRPKVCSGNSLRLDSNNLVEHVLIQHHILGDKISNIYQRGSPRFKNIAKKRRRQAIAGV